MSVFVVRKEFLDVNIPKRPLVQALICVLNWGFIVSTKYYRTNTHSVIGHWTISL